MMDKIRKGILKIGKIVKIRGEPKKIKKLIKSKILEKK
jgi:hypothetical protein